MMKSFSFAFLVLLAGCGGSDPHPNIVDATRPIDAAIDSAPDAPPSCVDSVSGCFKSDICQPQQLDDFLNACTDVPCQDFDNPTRLPLYNNGNLPQLPS